MPFESIKAGSKTLAIVFRGPFPQNGMTFGTSETDRQQLGVASYPSGKLFRPHTHTARVPEAGFSEVLIIRSGRIAVSLLDSDATEIARVEVGSGEAIIMLDCGHLIEVIESVEMYEVKHGPYAAVDTVALNAR